MRVIEDLFKNVKEPADNQQWIGTVLCDKDSLRMSNFDRYLDENSWGYIKDVRDKGKTIIISSPHNEIDTIIVDCDKIKDIKKLEIIKCNVKNSDIIFYNPHVLQNKIDFLFPNNSQTNVTLSFAKNFGDYVEIKNLGTIQSTTINCLDATNCNINCQSLYIGDSIDKIKFCKLKGCNVSCRFLYMKLPSNHFKKLYNTIDNLKRKNNTSWKDLFLPECNIDVGKFQTIYYYTPILGTRKFEKIILSKDNDVPIASKLTKKLKETEWEIGYSISY